MTHETRHGVRVVISLLHILIQVLVMWIIVGILDAKTTATTEELLHLNTSILSHMSIMVGSYCIYISLMRLFTGTNRKRSSSSSD